MSPVRSVLFVELLGGFGDLLLALPAIHALAMSHPQASVTVLTFAPGAALLAHDPLVDEVVVATAGPPEVQHATVERVLLRGFDLVVSDTRYGGLPELIASSALHHVTDLWRHPPPDERIDLRFLRLLAEDGVVAPRLRHLPPRVALTAAEREAGAHVLDDAVGARRVVALVVEAGMRIKEWPGDTYARLGRELEPGYAVVVVSGADPALAADVAARCGAATLPAMDLRQLAGTLAAARAVVAGDTGPARLASAVGTATVCLFGPTWAGRFGLREPHANLQSPLPCDVRSPADMTGQECWYSGRCVFDDRDSCVDDLSVVAVTDALRRLLQGEDRRSRSAPPAGSPPA